MTQRNYVAIKAEYVEGQVVDGRIAYPTFAEIAKKHGLDPGTLRRRAAKEKWTAARRKFAAKVTHVTQERKAILIGSQAARLDARAALIAGKVLEKIDREVEALKATGKGNKRVPLDVDRLKTLVSAAKEAQAVGRLALGQPLDPGAPPPDPTKDVPEVNLDDATDEELRTIAEGLARLSP